ncbi:hypothetical protein HJFPF1_06558 [Paramyrothecium foliicola]|nr:hypothetical protein HJFPF1_06558 [Paramyrothecium foliicola]
MFPTLIRRLAQPAKESAGKSAAAFNAAANPYKTRKVWPPNFKELNHQQQLRFEKKYKRRILLANRSPRWEKGVKYAQLATIAGWSSIPILSAPRVGARLGTDCRLPAAMLWLVFYAEFDWWGQKYKPSEEIRQRAAQLFGILNPEKRYERRPDAPPPPSPKEDQESK